MSPLSTVALCWKKIIQGVTVAPMLDKMMSRAPLLMPPVSGPQVTRACPTAFQLGRVRKASGMNTRLKAAIARVMRSQVQ